MKRKYPWEEWFRYPHTVLMRGIHYHCSQSTMAQTVRNNASSRDLRVHIVDTGTALIIKVVERREAGAIPHTNPTSVAS